MSDALAEHYPALPDPQHGEGDTPMFCTACGTKNSADANFCKECGHKVDRAAAHAITDEEFALPRTEEERAKDLLLDAYQHSSAGDFSAAVLACRQAIDLRPGSTDAHSLMSTLYEKQGLLDRAIGERERVLELNPGSIADREKLAQLRDGAQPGMRRVTSAHRPARQGLFDTPAGAGVAAAAAALLILLIGAVFVWAQSGRSQKASADQQAARSAPAATEPAQSPAAGAQIAQQPAAANPFQYSSAPPASAAQQPAEPYMPAREPNQRRQPAYATAGMEPSGRPTPPASVYVPRGPLEGYGQPGAYAGPRPDNTVHLPPDTAPSNPDGASPPTTPSSGGAAAPNAGQIRVVVEPRNGGSPAPTDGGAGTGATVDSHQQLQVARQYHLQGNYRAAMRAYIKALDGAGDDAADIHQQLGLCHQRLDERESAVSEYNQAIDGYRKQVAAGRNVDAANRGIRACEAGIRACQ